MYIFSGERDGVILFCSSSSKEVKRQRNFLLENLKSSDFGQAQILKKKNVRNQKVICFLILIDISLETFLFKHISNKKQGRLRPKSTANENFPWKPIQTLEYENSDAFPSIFPLALPLFSSLRFLFFVRFKLIAEFATYLP